MLSVEERNVLFPPILSALVRFCKAFPPLIEDVVGLLLQYGKICVSESCMKGYASPKNFDMSVGHEEALAVMGESTKEEVRQVLQQLPQGEPLAAKIQATFATILSNSLLVNNAF